MLIVFVYRLYIIGRQTLLSRKILKFIAIKTTDTTALCPKPDIALAVLMHGIDLRLRQAVGDGVFYEVVLLGLGGGID